MLTTTITVFNRDKAYSDALAILANAYDLAESQRAMNFLLDAMTHLQHQWNELQAARSKRMKGGRMAGAGQSPK
jgi:transcription termination factor Rho